ncbi:MAG: hypothetical protein ABEJ91_02340 [Candidatus Nanohaloarchaea archaeon]
MDSQFLMRILLYAAVTVTVITVATGGALGDSIKMGLSKSKNNTDYRIDIEGEHRLSDAALFVYHRASNDGCEKNGAGPTVPEQNRGEISNPDKGLTGEDWLPSSFSYDGGYPALTDTYLGLKPSCNSGVTTPLGTGWGDAISPVASSGGDMEGDYSRVSFEVKKKVTLNARSPDTWLEDHLIGVGRGGSFYSKVASSCQAYGDDLLVGYEWAYEDVNNNYVLIFKPDVPDSRANDWIGNRLSGPLYCDGCASLGWDCLVAPVEKKFPENHFKVTLCPGDRGYIQMNKGKKHSGKGPLNRGEAIEQSTSLFTGGEGAYPFIQISSVEQDTC